MHLVDGAVDLKLILFDEDGGGSERRSYRHTVDYCGEDDCATRVCRCLDVVLLFLQHRLYKFCSAET